MQRLPVVSPSSTLRSASTISCTAPTNGRGRRGIEDVDLVLVDDVPESGIVGIVGHALEHQRGRAVGERAVENVAVAGDPADVGGAPVDVAVVIVEDVLMRHGRIDEIAAGGV